MCVLVLCEYSVYMCMCVCAYVRVRACLRVFVTVWVRVRMYSRRSRIFLKRGPLSCEVPKSTRFSGGGGSSRHFPWSPKAVAIQWGEG